MDLSNNNCIPCRGGEPSLNDSQIKKYIKNVHGWQLRKNPKKIVKEFKFKNFKTAIKFVNNIAHLAEKEGHHPNIYIHSYNKVKLDIWTHKIGGLHKNDFILAAKIDELL